MAEIIKKPRGTQDLIGLDKALYDNLTDTLRKHFKQFCVEMIDIPSYEMTRLFVRGVGESTDIVNKELFNLEDKSDEKQSLRPEFTAGIIRCLIENKLYASPDLPYKFGYYGSAYRYERPQKGRFREFHQGGVEFLDKSIDLITTIDCISLFYSVASDFLKDKSLKVKINFLGNVETRQNWRNALKEYFKPYLDSMCEDCKRRYETNPLRILDCKIEHDNEIAIKAPTINNFATETEKEEFNTICEKLKLLNIPYEVDNNLVRGLDYYTGVVFELYSDKFNVALGGGGKYQNLSKELGGPELEGIGFSFGLERLIMCYKELNPNVTSLERKDYCIYTFNKTEKGLNNSFEIAEHIRSKTNYSVKISNFNKSLGSVIKQINREGFKYLLIINEDFTYEIKDLDNQVQTKYSSLKELYKLF